MGQTDWLISLLIHLNLLARVGVCGGGGGGSWYMSDESQKGIITSQQCFIENQ